MNNHALYNLQAQQRHQPQNPIKNYSSSLQSRLYHGNQNVEQQKHNHHNHCQQQYQRRQQHQQHQNYLESQYHSQEISSVGNAESSQNAISEQDESNLFVLNYLEEVINRLSSDPGSFDTIAPQALTILEGYGDNNYVLSIAMETIFNQSIEDQNFRYMGAKLYGLLDSINSENDSVFRNLLDLKLNDQRDEIIHYLQNEQSKVRGTTLFLAELYMQLRHNGIRVQKIAQNIIFTMKQLLVKSTPENIKCICLTLKLAGYDLEADCSNELFKIIESLRENKSMDVSTTRILETTLSLQKNNWGRCETTNQTNHSTNTIRYSNEPVFYGPDGKILTEEENSFLEENIPSDGINDDDPDFDEIEPEDGMDPEMESDYNEFLKTTMNHSR